MSLLMSTQFQTVKRWNDEQDHPNVYWIWKERTKAQKKERERKKLAWNCQRIMHPARLGKNVISWYLCKKSYHIVPSNRIVDKNHPILNKAVKRMQYACICICIGTLPTFPNNNS